MPMGVASQIKLLVCPMGGNPKESSNRLIMSCYGNGNAIDIRLMDTDKDLQHQINITVDDDGKLKAIVSEQTK